MVALHRARGLKRSVGGDPNKKEDVAPFTGAWIETRELSPPTGPPKPSRGGGGGGGRGRGGGGAYFRALHGRVDRNISNETSVT